MKTVTVRYQLTNNYNNPKTNVERFLIEDDADIQEALKEGLITHLHIEGIRKCLVKDRVILNDKGGYCDMKGTWQIISKPYDLHKAMDAMLNGKSFRLRKSEREQWKKEFLTSVWFHIQKIHSDGEVTICGTNHEVLENVHLDCLVGAVSYCKNS